jgi:hypothetical protein
MPDIEVFLSAFLRGENSGWPFGQDESFVASFLERADYHGVLALLHGRLQREATVASGWPDAVRQACRQRALEQAMWELRHRAMLRDVFSSLAAVGIKTVVFKGTALAYTLYPEGTLRSRGDTDLIIPPQSLAPVADILNKLGFERQTGMVGESVAYQASFTRTESAGDSHTLDIHWRINNSELLSRLFSHEELLQNAQPVPELGPDALAAGPVHALLIACMHRATHKHNPYYVDNVAYYSGDRLIWLYDIHLLANSFTSPSWEEFVHLAEQKGLRSVCLEGLERARINFDTAIPEHVRFALENPGQTEVVARYFARGVLGQLWMDFCALPGITHKLRHLAETVFPPASYMRQKYPQTKLNWLPWLYLRRATGGMLKRLQRREQPH